jgi:hypothetical protein
VGRQERGVAEEPEHQLDRVDRGPQHLGVRLDRAAAGDGVLHAVVGGVTGRLHPQQHRVREPLRQHRATGAVPDATVAQLGDEFGRLVRRHPPPVRPARDDQRLGRLANGRPHGPAQHLRHPRVALEHVDRGRTRPGDPDPPDEFLDRGLPRVDLAEGREDVADVPQEARVRPDHQHALPAELVAVGIQQVRRPVQPDRRLPGARRTLDADRVLDPGPHDHVLLGLDGGDDVAHRAGPRSLDLGVEDVAVLVGRSRRGQVLVLERGHRAVREPEPAAQPDPHRLGPAGPVERRGDVGPPVDDQRVAGRVVDVPAADVERLRPLGTRQGLDVVQPAEEQRHVGVVLELLHPPPQGGLEEFGVDPVGAVDLQRSGLGPHRRQRGPGGGQVVAFGFEDGV